MRVLTRPASCELQVRKGVVALTPCQGDRYSCDQRLHRVFTGMAMVEGPDGMWLISGDGWWYGSFKNDDRITITIPCRTEDNDLSDCDADTPSPILPLSPEGAHKVAQELIRHHRVNNLVSTGGGFERMEFCSACNKLKPFDTLFLSTKEVRERGYTLLLPQHAQPIIWMLRHLEGLCTTQH
ncbi:MAG TPA: hypothetical protein VFT59_05620 [Candidatus Saccharimonadales bacterium]|nr:hypothetical protein [Candidatus Saccharimonadales bacterium]